MLFEFIEYFNKNFHNEINISDRYLKKIFSLNDYDFKLNYTIINELDIDYLINLDYYIKNFIKNNIDINIYNIIINFLEQDFNKFKTIVKDMYKKENNKLISYFIIEKFFFKNKNNLDCVFQNILNNINDEIDLIEKILLKLNNENINLYINEFELKNLDIQNKINDNNIKLKNILNNE